MSPLSSAQNISLSLFPELANGETPQNHLGNDHAQEMTQRDSRLRVVRRSITGLFNLPTRHRQSQQYSVSDRPPTLPLELSSAPSPPAPVAHPARLTPDPASIPIPPSPSTTAMQRSPHPLLFGETSETTPAAPFSAEESAPNALREGNKVQRRSLLDKLICPNPKQHTLATVLIHRAERRHRRAWIKKRGHTSVHVATVDPESGYASPAPLLPGEQRSDAQPTIAYERLRRLYKKNRIHHKPRNSRALRLFLFAVLLIAVASAYLGLALTQNGNNGSQTLPKGVHAVFIILILLLFVLVLHALILILVPPRPSSKPRSRRNRPRHRHGHGHRRARPHALDLEAAHPPHAHVIVEREVDIDSDASADDDNDDDDAASAPDPHLDRDPNALPNDDTLYTPTTPIRVHLVSDPLPTGGKPVPHAPVVVSPPAHIVTTFSEGRRRSSPVSPLTPASPAMATTTTTTTTTTPPLDGPLADEEPLPEPDTDPLTAPAAPPSYGEWRCSVRADPNLLFWRRVPPASASASVPAPARALSSPSLPPSPLSTGPSSPTNTLASHGPHTVTCATAPNSPAARSRTIIGTTITAPPAYTDILSERTRAAHEAARREDAADEWPLGSGFGGAAMERGVRVVMEDAVQVGSDEGDDVAGLTRALLRQAGGGMEMEMGVVD